MLDDRFYMRQPSFRRGMLWTYKLMIANAVIWLVFSVIEASSPVFGEFVSGWLALSPAGLGRGFLWQFVTFQFLHAGWLHLLLNLLVIFFFGRAIEETLGARRMLQLYFTCGSVGGICQVIFYMLLAWLRDPRVLGWGVVGASAGAFGLVAAFATLFPQRRITLLLFFVLPITLTARMLFWISVALGAAGVLDGLGVPGFGPLAALAGGRGVAHAAHLGGILAAVLFVRAIVLEQISLPRIRLVPRARVRPRVRVMKASGKRSGPAGPPDSEEFNDDFIAREVDPILEKISARGIQSLTERERRILQAARSRMQKP